MKMDFVIRVDASKEIGSGHVMRCLALAHRLRNKGGTVRFLSRACEGNLCDLIEREGLSVSRLGVTGGAGRGSGEDLHPDDWRSDAEAVQEVLKRLSKPPDWLIVDHYALDSRWECALRSAVPRIMVIDDLSNRPHDCDLLLDSNYREEGEVRYDGLLPPGCHTLLGPWFALLRPEFYHMRSRFRDRSGRIERIHIFFGACDLTNESAKALEAVTRLDLSPIHIDLVVGAANPHKDSLRRKCEGLSSCNFHCQTPRMAELMVHADLAMGAGGTTTWERCFLGLPSITVVVAENQLSAIRSLAAAGGTCFLGWNHEVTADRLALTLQELVADPKRLREMSVRGRKIMEGNKATAVADELFDDTLIIRDQEEKQSV